MFFFFKADYKIVSNQKSKKYTLSDFQNSHRVCAGFFIRKKKMREKIYHSQKYVTGDIWKNWILSGTNYNILFYENLCNDYEIAYHKSTIISTHNLTVNRRTFQNSCLSWKSNCTFTWWWWWWWWCWWWWFYISEVLLLTI